MKPMARITYTALVTVFVAMTAGAADLQRGSKQLSLFLSDVGYGRSSINGESTTKAGLALAFSYAWTANVSTELSAGRERSERYITELELSDNPDFPFLYPEIHVEKVNVHPIDLVTKYHFQTSSRWTPYIGGGLRYVSGPRSTFVSYEPFDFNNPIPPTLVVVRQPSNYRASAELVGGIGFRLSQRFGAQFDVKQLLRSDSVRFDPTTKASAGLSFYF